MTQSRRTFLKASASLAAATVLPEAGFSSTLAPSTPLATLSQFDYGDVELLDGPLRQQFDTNHAFYAALDEDSLLKPFRQRAGIAAPGDEMGGWYSWAPLSDLDKPGNNGFAPGHSFGQYLSGLSRDYAATGNRDTQQKVHRLIREFAPAISERFWEGNRFPAYTYDKISIGLLDAHQFTGAPQALKVLDRVLDSVSAHLPPGGLSRDQQHNRPHIDESFCWDEPYTLPENFFIAYQRGAGKRYRDMATRFLADEWYFTPLANGQNVLIGKHAYSHVNAMSSAMQAYLQLGSRKHLLAAQAGFDFLSKGQSFATGGWGPNEVFSEPGALNASLTKTHSSFETPCGSYAHFKLTRYLLRATRDTRYGDSMERVLYNCILGAKPIQKDGHGFYYSDYNNEGSKSYHPYKWHCCTGTFSQVTADYGISSYLHDEQGIYVNLYVPSRVTWNRHGEKIVLKQTTDYPHRPTTQIEVISAKPAAFPIYLRIPSWAGPKTVIFVNGKSVSTSPATGTFARLDQHWKNGDRIEVEFDMRSELASVEPGKDRARALVHGPLALFTVGNIPASIRESELLAAAPISSGSEKWEAKTLQGKITLRPFSAITDEPYRLYLDTSPRTDEA